MPTLERIVSLISSATEFLYALGLAERVVAVSHECDFPPAALGKPKATRSHIDSSQPSDTIDEQVRRLSARGASLYSLDESLLANLSPDLIITQAQCDVCAVRYADVVDFVKSRPELAQTRILALNPRSLAEVLEDAQRVGDAAGVADIARLYVALLLERIERVRVRSASISTAERPRVVCIEWISPLMLAANWTPELVALAGGESGLARPGRHSVYNDWNEVLAYDPEVLFSMPCGFDLPRTLVESQSLAALPGWQELSAVRSSRVFAFDGNAYFNRSGPRLVESLEILAHLLHPSIFSPPLEPDARDRAWQEISQLTSYRD